MYLKYIFKNIMAKVLVFLFMLFKVTKMLFLRFIQLVDDNFQTKKSNLSKILVL